MIPPDKPEVLGRLQALLRKLDRLQDLRLVEISTGDDLRQDVHAVINLVRAEPVEE